MSHVKKRRQSGLIVYIVSYRNTLNNNNWRAISSMLQNHSIRGKVSNDRRIVLYEKCNSALKQGYYTAMNFLWLQGEALNDKKIFFASRQNSSILRYGKAPLDRREIIWYIAGTF